MRKGRRGGSEGGREGGRVFYNPLITRFQNLKNGIREGGGEGGEGENSIIFLSSFGLVVKQ